MFSLFVSVYVIEEMKVRMKRGVARKTN